MYNHNTIKITTILIKTNIIKITKPITTIHLNTPTNLIITNITINNNTTTNITLHNITSYLNKTNTYIQIPKFNKIHYNITYNNNFYTIIKLTNLKLPFNQTTKHKILQTKLTIITTINKPHTKTHNKITHTITILHYYTQQIFNPIKTIHKPSNTNLLLTQHQPLKITNLITP